jgi:lipopolysaccharide biosynthesis glycosyltransferase
MRCPIFLACDDAYGMPLATTLRSITDANRQWWPLEVCIFAFSISDSTRKKVLDSLPDGAASIRWIPVDPDPFKNFSTLDHVSKATYARFLIPAIVPETTAKALYLDADLLVLRDLAALWETDLKEAVVAAVLDGLDAHIKAGKPGLADLPRVEDYFNAGVLLINLPKWRKELISEKAMEYLKQNPTSPFSDQDALNVACDGIWKKLDPRWNFVDHYEQVDISSLSVERRPWIIHFATWRKPWNASTLNVNASLYDSFRSRTIFARTPFQVRQDALLICWCRMKRVLKEYPTVRAIWSQIKVIFAQPFPRWRSRPLPIARRSVTGKDDQIFAETSNRDE